MAWTPTRAVQSAPGPFGELAREGGRVQGPQPAAAQAVDEALGDARRGEQRRHGDRQERRRRPPREGVEQGERHEQGRGEPVAAALEREPDLAG